ncbi:SDR family NAD(P)-dependent oxidoreductase [Lujinxingia vulgaris]|uniref:SDR family NAD(P)-dependent oxidoreductase n=1 Tax=Lujinxingia vulgaris TaxID=2600176 RepID=A0A5C6X409_9DELT|nr:SDR family NAD(P)-dependent oxidoreductase [Lujinxingia vulgaris]TXD36466.1 SDR family NAD(P)-dependent oxidoreductase [Lujinxingia vulgaris]
MNIAIITGASAGMGRHFALQFDGRADIDEIWLVARRKERLEALAGELKQTRGRVFAVDLCDEDALNAFFATLDEEAPSITWLINNAGFGKIGRFDQVPVSTNLQMIDLNIRALTEITQRALPFCKKGSHIVQVASSAGFLPITNFAVYAASKAFVVNFSNALSRELKPRGIGVTAVCPGPVQTEFFNVAASHGGTKAGPDGVMADPEHVVARAIKDAERHHLNSVYGLSIKAFILLTRFLPRQLAIRATERIYG